ncbi:MAG: N-acetyl-beta-hexosaminidase, partial [Bacteroidetes bacterium]|nr:N-acetyl-beta-hexosaminidase [Bacteroidota bacterium]
MNYFFFRSILFCTLFFCLVVPKGWTQIQASWSLDENKITAPQQHKATLTLTNRGTGTLDAGWKLYFNTIFISIRSQSLDPKLSIKHLQGDFFVWEGETPALKPKESFSLSYRSSGIFLKNAYPPEGLIILHADGKVEEVSEYQKEVITEANLVELATGTSFPVSTSAQRYVENRELFSLPDQSIPPYLPSPKSWKYTGPTVSLSPGTIQVEGVAPFEKAKEYLDSTLKNGFLPKSSSKAPALKIRLEWVATLPEEGYLLTTTRDQVLIQASSTRGALYGVNSFLALLPPAFWKDGVQELVFPQLEIEDAPAFGYRGLFLDVARNFQSKQQVFKLLDLMSFYKLNVFHFNLANDEGWRIEIPGLPELTEFGGSRGFSVDESEFLWPYYASGADPGLSTTGTGFYTAADFQEILTYARDRNIEVIPELGVPAHSRAAILAMEKRYRTFMQAGKEQEALAFRLADPADESKYLSAQNFTGNTVCVCQESTYAFYEKLVVEIGKMYASAGLEAKNWHSGGDEVPRGVWTQSPVCADFLAKNPQLQTGDLLDYFRERTANILEKYGWK